jgi:hypothetical protein
MRWLDVAQDVRYATRSLRRSPGFAVVAVLTLALGIGATTAICSVVDTILLQPLPFAGADALVQIAENVPSSVPGRQPFQRAVTYQGAGFQGNLPDARAELLPGHRLQVDPGRNPATLVHAPEVDSCLAGRRSPEERRVRAAARDARSAGSSRAGPGPVSRRVCLPARPGRARGSARLA